MVTYDDIYPLNFYFKAMPNPGAKTRILDAACRLFYIQGYSLTGINQIIEEAKVAKASLYQHFKSKEDLAFAYLQLKSEEWKQAINTHLEQYKHPKDRILGIFDFMEIWQDDEKMQGCNFLNMLNQVPIDETRIHKKILIHKEQEIQLYEKLTTEAGFPNPQVASQQISLLVQGATIQTKLHGNLSPMKNAKALMQMWLSALD